METKKQAISGVKWTTLSTVVVAVCSILKISVLARFLNSSDFGLMALVTFVLGFMDLFMDMGLTSAILYKQSITREEYNSLFWLNVMFSLILFFCILLFAPLVASFYEEPKLTVLLPLMGFGVIFSAFGRQYKTILQKELKFKTIALTEILAIVFSLILAIVLALKNFGVYSLVLSALLQYFLANTIFFVIGIKTNRLSLHFNFQSTSPFLRIGFYKVGGQIINYFNRDLDILIIGKFFGAELLGGYSLAKQLVKRPMAIFDQIVLKVSVSILPRFQDNKKALLNSFLMLIRGMSMINAIIYGVMALSAPFLVNIFYGEEYGGILNFVRLFAIIFYFRSIGGIVGILAITKGRTDIEFYWNVLLLCVFPVVIFAGAQINLEMILILIAALQIILNLPLWQMFYKKLVGIELFDYLRALCFPAIISGSVFIIFDILFENHTGIMAQGGFSLLLTIVIVVYAYVTDSNVRHYIKSIIKKQPDKVEH
ncbi:MOP flippase family protein [Allomuricauda sp. M10]|uniref:MOP flippase family protein n=1 Tax=Allomuricauda sp. M10 TaxID=2683292 RepID=UPI001D18C4AE|nr:MOP flippase family protein [Muricauda sp. M10]